MGGWFDSEKPITREQLEQYERSHEPQRPGGGALAAGVLAGVFSGAGFGALVLLWPFRAEPGLTVLWAWFGWPLGLAAALFGGFIVGGFVHHVMSRRADRGPDA